MNQIYCISHLTCTSQQPHQVFNNDRSWGLGCILMTVSGWQGENLALVMTYVHPYLSWLTDRWKCLGWNKIWTTICPNWKALIQSNQPLNCKQELTIYKYVSLMSTWEERGRQGMFFRLLEHLQRASTQISRPTAPLDMKRCALISYKDWRTLDNKRRNRGAPGKQGFSLMEHNTCQ